MTPNHPSASENPAEPVAAPPAPAPAPVAPAPPAPAQPSADFMIAPPALPAPPAPPVEGPTGAPVWGASVGQTAPPMPTWGRHWGMPAEPAAPAAPKKDRRVLRAMARWTAAVLVFAALGGATAYGVTQPRRTDIPGLRTPGDGRWTYRTLKLPQLPAGKPRPFALNGNPAKRHYADLRKLVLPAPQGAKVDKDFAGSEGWRSTAAFVTLFRLDERKDLALRMEQDTLRHIAARAWTMPDGTRAEVYLLQYASAAYAERSLQDVSDNGVFVHAATAERERHDLTGIPEEVTALVYNEAKPRGDHHIRYAYIGAGDTVALVYLSRAGSQPSVPFNQAVTLQAQLLG